jgi:hypothetical protein
MTPWNTRRMVTDTLNPKTKEDYREALAQMRWRFVRAVTGLQNIREIAEDCEGAMRGVYDEAESALSDLIRIERIPVSDETET